MVQKLNQQQPGPVKAPTGPPVTSKAPPGAPVKEQSKTPTKPPAQGEGFRGLPRAYQKQVERGETTLESAIKEAQNRGEYAKYNGEGNAPGGGGGGGGGPRKGFAESLLGGSEELGGQADQHIKDYYDKILSGEESRFSPKVMAQLKQGIFRESKGAAKGGRDQAMVDAARFGNARGGVLQARLQEIDTTQRAQYTQGVTDIMIEKAKTEFDDKFKALAGTQTWLDSKRSFFLGQKQIEATIRSAEIQAGATVAAAALSAKATRAAAGMSAGAARHNANLAHQEWQAEFDYAVSQNNLGAAERAAGYADLS